MQVGYNIFNNVRNMATIYCVRGPFLAMQLAGLLAAVDVVFRPAQKIAGKTFDILPIGKKRKKSVHNWFEEKSKNKSVKQFLDYVRPQRDKEWYKVAAWAVGLLLVSDIGLWAVSQAIKPHWLYNKVLDNISYIQLRMHGNPIATFTATATNLWQSVTA